MTKFTHLYEALLLAAASSANAKSTSIMDKAIHDGGMTKCPAEDRKFPEFDAAHEVVDGDERLFIQYRWYDTSKTFSIQPDMNVYLLRHTKGSELIAEKQIKFLDET